MKYRPETEVFVEEIGGDLRRRERFVFL